MFNTETINNQIADVLADHDIIVSPSFGLLHIEATPNSGKVVIVKSVRGTEYLYLWLERRENGWHIAEQGKDDPKLSAEQQAEISALVRQWARTHVQNFVEADRDYFFDLIEANADILADDNNSLLDMPGVNGEDADFHKAMEELGPSFLTPPARDGVRRSCELLTSAQTMIREAEALLRQAAAERKAA